MVTNEASEQIPIFDIMSLHHLVEINANWKEHMTVAHMHKGVCVCVFYEQHPADYLHKKLQCGPGYLWLTQIIQCLHNILCVNAVWIQLKSISDTNGWVCDLWLLLSHWLYQCVQTSFSSIQKTIIVSWAQFTAVILLKCRLCSWEVPLLCSLVSKFMAFKCLCYTNDSITPVKFASGDSVLPPERDERTKLTSANSPCPRHFY